MNSRVLVPELMDDPAIDPVEHRRALNGLRRINKLCQTGSQLAKEILAIAKRYQRTEINILDIGCGSGDVAFDVARRLASHLQCRIIGWDISQTAVACASADWTNQKNRMPAEKRSNIEIHFQQADVFQPSEAKFDIVYCCLFLHHFTEQQAVQVLTRMREIASLAVVVDDLIRSRTGYALAQIGCQLLSSSPVVHFDGPQSVRAAFTESEAKKLATEAGMKSCTTRKHWPERYLLRWDA
jgi:2-polyprenyl-3-methyl-5-hydroxy-6-metoxy-1,4-benzoquinol methylase